MNRIGLYFAAPILDDSASRLQGRARKSAATSGGASPDSWNLDRFSVSCQLGSAGGLFPQAGRLEAGELDHGVPSIGPV